MRPFTKEEAKQAREFLHSITDAMTDAQAVALFRHADVLAQRIAESVTICANLERMEEEAAVGRNTPPKLSQPASDSEGKPVVRQQFFAGG
jgi:hypothetical protein